MANNTRLLEDLVTKAVDRLKELTEDRDRLEAEVRALKVRLDEMESERRSPAEEAAWVAQRAETLGALRDTISELRGD